MSLGREQGGIITPSQHSLVIIITGEEGLAHGYDDRTRDDGVFEYFGEGQVGDMVLQQLPPEIQSRGTEFLDAETGRQNPPERPLMWAEIANVKKRLQDPRRNGLFRLATVSAVREDWMVETEGTKLPTPPAVISNQSLTTAPGTEISDAETGAQNPPFRLLETDTETRRDSKSPRSGAISAKKTNGVRSL
jgi:5-methylcytosine-specific restriction protein A